MKTKIFIPIVIGSLTLISAGCYKQDHELLRPSVKSESSKTTAKEQLPIKENYTTPLLVKDKKILVEIADTDQSRELGLSKRLSISDNLGMLFDFSNTSTTSATARPGFWMKDMNFNIDIIWINNGKIIAIDADAKKPTPEINRDTSKLQTYYPPSNITHVLEVESGWCKKNNINVGDEIKFVK